LRIERLLFAHATGHEDRWEKLAGLAT
jgi:hypothetical protein